MTIYFVQLDNRSGPVKIGFSRDFYRRYRRLHTQFPGRKIYVLNLIDGTRPDERRMHCRFGACWIEKELFRMEGSLQEYLRDIPPPSMKAILGKRKTGGALVWGT